MQESRHQATCRTQIDPGIPDKRQHASLQKRTVKPRSTGDSQRPFGGKPDALNAAPSMSRMFAYLAAGESLEKLDRREST
jgi:hypothetical protein